MATTKLPAELEIDHERGVIYVHIANPGDILALGVQTALRISGLPRPIPQIHDRMLDIGIHPKTHLDEKGVTYFANFDWGK